MVRYLIVGIYADSKSAFRLGLCPSAWDWFTCYLHSFILFSSMPSRRRHSSFIVGLVWFLHSFNIICSSGCIAYLVWFHYKERTCIRITRGNKNQIISILGAHACFTRYKVDPTSVTGEVLQAISQIPFSTQPCLLGRQVP